ncbi:MAG: hypothetical protein FJ095_13835 [Deltaproteobacteria bacterium]|nr:hypothetical protein [Deltaproteobacteria bacterium]
MKLKSMAWLGIAGGFVGAAALVSACGTSDNTSTSGGDGACGNAVVDVGEECDDGNLNDNDGCTQQCTKGEPTPTGSATAASSGGGASCGNGKLDPGEACDDGNDVDSDSCHNNCTSNAPKTCGNGAIDAGEECDDGNMVADDMCTNLCTKPKCGDGIIQAGEDCDDGINNENMGMCPKDCKNPSGPASSSATVDPCMGQKTFFGVVSNNQNPVMTGSGIASKWTYNGLEGVQAGNAMCQAIGADHICNYGEVVKAEAAGELAMIPPNLTYWLHRTNKDLTVLDPANKTCTIDTDCNAPGVLAFCDPVQKKCAWKAGAGARCNDWTYPTGHISDGEWFAPTTSNNAMPGTGVTKGTMVYHFDADSFYDGVSGAHLCQNNSKVGCAGGCAGAPPRAILCCNPTCM